VADATFPNVSGAVSEFQYWMMRYRRTWRRSIVLSVANPVLFFVGIGVGLGRLIDAAGGSPAPGVPYLDYLAPGLLAAAAMQTAAIESIGPAYQALYINNHYKLAAATPVEPEGVLGGHVLFVVFRVATSAAAFYLVMLACGLFRSAWVLLDLPVAVLTGMAFAAPFMALGVWVRREGALRGVYRFLIMPLYLFSGTYVAVTQLPIGIRFLAYALPLWHGVQLCRALALGTPALGPALGHLAYLLGVTIAGLYASRAAYRRRLHG
jgi:lipooligosaccharide transport system permease protein